MAAMNASLKPANEYPSSTTYDEEVGGAVPRGMPVYDGSAMVKNGFIRKVYGILSVQLAFTVLSALFFTFHDGARSFVLSNPNMLMTAAFAPFGFLLALYCYKDRHPLNMGLLAGFTLCITYTVGAVCASYYANGLGPILLQSLVLTLAVFCSLTAYVFITKKDFSFLGGGLFAALIIMMVWSLFFPMGFTFGLGSRMVFSALMALIFVGYILYDTSLILHHMGPDDYIIATVTLYLDIINLFLYLLEILRMLQGGGSD